MQKRKQRTVAKKTLGPGLHPGVVELATGDTFRVQLMAGGYVHAHLESGVSRALVERCMRTARKVLLADGPRGPLILGALQTNDEEGRVEETLRLRADKELSLEVGSTRLLLTHDGKIRVEGRDLAMDVSALVRFLSARVELP
jgi:hypothetical protein